MRWLTFALFAVLAMTLQTTVAPRLELFSARPDWLLVAVVFLALYAPKRDAVIGAWLLGGGADLMTLERLGLISLTYGLVALAVVSIRDSLFRYSSITQFAVTLLSCLLVRIAWDLYQRVLYDPAVSVFPNAALHILTVSVYTAVWAPLLHKGLLRMGNLFGFIRPRYTYAGLHRTGGSRV